MRLATGDRKVTLVHCLEDRLCVWRPDSLTEFSYQVVLIEGHPTWSGRAKHSYGHLLFLDLDEGFFSVQRHVASARSFNSYLSLLQMTLII